MTLTNGVYITKAGSTVTISGKYSGIAEVDFDWLEEGGCIECEPHPYPSPNDGGWDLIWDCEECGGGRAPLRAVE